MATANDKISEQYKNWLRLMTLTDFGGNHLCRDVLFKRENLPTDGTLLFKILEPLKPQMQFQDQRNTLCPSTGTTDCDEFDLTLFTSVIAKLFKDRYKSLVQDLRGARNTEFHRGNKRISDNKFKLLWYKTMRMLEKHGFDTQLVVDLEVCDLFSHEQFKNTAISIQGSTDRFLLLQCSLQKSCNADQNSSSEIFTKTEVYYSSKVEALGSQTF